ncbi:MAG: uracil-DNA glycosylase [Streptosporangiales bacterium]|nr:uracil-DNA glycosylase [Streptosporangiales bacterium]
MTTLGEAWEDLSRSVRACTTCPELAEARTQVVAGVRPAGFELRAARVLLVGEAPGAQEDAEGVPFVGRAGQLLDRLLGEAGLPRESVAVANVLKCRPPGNRKPTRTEVRNCASWLTRQIELIDPQVIMALGGTAAEWFLGPSVKIGRAREETHAYEGRTLLISYHPSAAIRFGPSGAPRAALEADLRRLAALVMEPTPGTSELPDHAGERA